MSPLAPGIVVPAPMPTPPLHSLIASAILIPEDGTTRWEAGFSFRPENCALVNAWDPCPPVGVRLPKGDASATQGIVDYDPFTLEIADECSSWSYTLADYEGRARRQLEAGTAKGLELEFWSGTLKPGNPHLTDSNVNVLNNGTPTDPGPALAFLQQALADAGAGGRGMIHATPYLAELWGGRFVIQEVGGKLVARTRGTIIVSGGGYPGTGPNNSPPNPGFVWAYATPLVYYRLSAIEVYGDTIGEHLDRETNDISYRAERSAAAYFDPCCQAAILVDLTDEFDWLTGS